MNAGDLVTPNIRLTRLLGEGGMGSIWVAEHLTLQTEVVVKFIQGAHAANADLVARFKREAALAAQARSPHVVQVFDHGISNQGAPFIAMEYLNGEDLGAYLDREGCVSVATYADWLRQIAKGLTRTHAQGIIHRDIKPENLFLSETDGEITVKLLDFGVAKGDPASGFATTNTGAVVGTVYYMSPEQALGSADIDHRTDLWALGAVSYFALTGNRPFTGASILQLLSAITSGKFTPPSHWRSELGANVDSWMERALARDASQRFASARAMAEAFVAAVQGSHGPLKPFSDSQPEPLQRPTPLGDLVTDRTLGAAISPLRDARPEPRSHRGRRTLWWTASAGAALALGLSAYVASRSQGTSSNATVSDPGAESLLASSGGSPVVAPTTELSATVPVTRSPATTAITEATISVSAAAPENVSPPPTLPKVNPVRTATARAPVPNHELKPAPASEASAVSTRSSTLAPKSPLQMNLE